MNNGKKENKIDDVINTIVESDSIKKTSSAIKKFALFAFIGFLIFLFLAWFLNV